MWINTVIGELAQAFAKLSESDLIRYLRKANPTPIFLYFLHDLSFEIFNGHYTVVLSHGFEIYTAEKSYCLSMLHIC